jgi:hypothetical protein
MQIHFRIHISYAKFFKVIALIDNTFAFALQIRVLAFLHCYFMLDSLTRCTSEQFD